LTICFSIGEPHAIDVEGLTKFDKSINNFIPLEPHAMDAEDLKKRTKRFALRILKLAAALPNTVEGRAIRGQLVRAGTSVGANYRAACLGRSRREFIAKIGTVQEESDESAFWLELIIEGSFMKADLVKPLLEEAEELRRIMAKSRISAFSRSRSRNKNNS
jgi:four helix bundle protein